LSDFLDSEERKSLIDDPKDLIRKISPRVDFGKMNPIGFSKKGNNTEIVSFGPKGGESKNFKSDGFGRQKSFTDKFSKALGPRAEEIIDEYGDTIKEKQQRLAEAENELNLAKSIAAKKEKIELQLQEFIQKIDKTQARIDAIQSEQVSNLENEAEIQRLKILKKNYQTKFENKKKKN